MSNAGGAGTEGFDPRFAKIEHWPTSDAVAAIIADQAAGLRLALASAGVIAVAAQAAAERLADSGGRIVFAGAGTSGRVAVQDGVELHPTYGWPKDRLLFLLAGGSAALLDSIEGAEDDEAAGHEQVADNHIGPADVVICVAASGRTPFTCVVAGSATRSGALSIGICNNLGAPLASVVQHSIAIPTGPEVIAGSTRMKAGTVQKAVLNALSTAIMLRLGLVEGGWMVAMRVSNEKLKLRSVAIVQAAAGVSPEAAVAALEAKAYDIRAAISAVRAASR